MMPKSPRPSTGSRLLPTAALGVLLTLASCARTSVQYVGADTRPLPRPDRIVVLPFQVSPDQVALDQTMGLRLQEVLGATSDDRERLRIARELADIVSRRLVADLRARGWNVADGPAGPSGVGRALEIDGQLLSIDQGSQRQRMIVGFGMGASEVRVLVQAFEVTESGRRLVDDFYINTQSSRRPGMGPMAGGGAVAANATAALALSGTSALVGARAQTVEADAQNLADRIGAELDRYFEQQNWSPPQ